MVRRGLRVIVTLAVLLVPACAFARGTVGVGGARGWGRRGSLGYTSAPQLNQKPVPTLGRRFPWEPPPFVVRGSQFMQCAGRTIAPGASPQAVRSVCGAPTRTRLRSPSIFTSNRTVEVWSYTRPNRVIRKLRFENGVLASIGTVHRPNR